MPLEKIFLEAFPNKNVRKIRQQVNPGLAVLRYQEALTAYKNNGVLDFSILEDDRKSLDPEIPRWFYHPTHGKFYGFARDLVREYPEVDEGNLCRVSRGLAKQTRGWVREAADVKNLTYDVTRDRWRYANIKK
jgi:hypothetical protein